MILKWPRNPAPLGPEAGLSAAHVPFYVSQVYYLSPKSPTVPLLRAFRFFGADVETVIMS
jgi:hypothetical protein